MKQRLCGSRSWIRLPFLGGIAVASAVSGTAHSMSLGDNPDVEIRFDNTLTYNTGVRTQNVDPRIGADPVNQSSDYKFSRKGDLVTNRLGLFSEFDVNVRNQYGFRVSGSAWKDFAYDDTFEARPGNLAPGVPYSSLLSSSTGRYSSYTKKYYMQGAELSDAFVFANFSLADMAASVKLGRVNIYWGNALFASFQSISYSQGPVDAIKASRSPGTLTKELFMPRAQLAAQVQLNDEWSVAGQYFLEFRPNRLPEGGTFDGAADFLFRGADQLAGGPAMGGMARGSDITPKHNNGNFGMALRWAPASLGSNIGLYVRQFDEVMPWTPLMGIATGAPEYHLAYAKKTKLIGASLDMAIGPVSTGFEASYRKDTALASSFAPNMSNLAGTEGARGDVINLVANGLYTLPKSAVWDTGTFIVEAAATRLLSVSSNEGLYKGVGYQSCATLSKKDGCATRNSLSLALGFTPQWLQVAPGLDVSLPISYQYGLIGNPAVLGGRVQGSSSFSLGVQGVYLSQYTFALAYSGTRARTNGEKLLPNGESVFASGNGGYSGNDRDRLTFTFQTTF